MKTQAIGEVAIQSLKGKNVSIHAGEDAWQLLANTSFLASWDKLFESCTWATIFQHQSFALTWYQVYRKRFFPVLVIAENGDRLTGLLALAVPVSGKKGQIVGAGHFDAEYHTWLTDGTDNGMFIQAALSKVLQQYPQRPVYLRFIPPHTPIQWIQEPKWKKRCVWQTAIRPLMNMNDPGIDKFFRKDDLKLKLNRLKRFGNVVFEHITDKRQFENIFTELATLYDFRQGAMFNKNQFRDDPFKKDFILALFDQNLLHVTVLKVDEKIVASISAVTDEEWVYLSGGFNVHAPFNAKRTSPGFVSFLLLGQQLIDEGIAVLDLTPGGDSYKERLATHHETVVELIVTDNIIYRSKRKLRKKVYASLVKAGKWPMGAELMLRKQLYLLKNKLTYIKNNGLLKMAVGGVKSLIKPPQLKVFATPAAAIASNGTITVNKNKLNDLLCFEAKGTRQSRWEFLEDAMRRYGQGESSYTYSVNDRLLYCIWLTNTPKSDIVVKKTTSEKWQEGPLHLENMYCHPEGEGLQIEFVRSVAHAVNAEYKNTTIHLITSTQNTNLCKILSAMGFVSPISDNKPACS